MKTLTILTVLVTLTSCSTNPQGQKTFLNRTQEQWSDIGFNTGKRTIPIVVEEYNKTASK